MHRVFWNTTKSGLPKGIFCEMLTRLISMSEYKYACPVCGQHMRCDSSQAGTVTECPTCFQKIIAPQAPAPGEEQKFVLTGTKVGDRPAPKMPEAGANVAVPTAKNHLWIILIVVLVAGL